MIRMLRHSHYPTFAYEVSWRIRTVVALRTKVFTRCRFTPFDLTVKFGSPVFPTENSAHIQLLTRSNISLQRGISKALKKKKKE